MLESFTALFRESGRHATTGHLVSDTAAAKSPA